MDEREVVDELAECVACCRAVKGNKEHTVGRKLKAMNIFREKKMGLFLPVTNIGEEVVKQELRGRTRLQGRSK